jgi:hypothetical protein
MCIYILYNKHRIARRAISKPVSISALGKDLRTVPTYDQVLQWFQ